jgi:TonB family protein
MTTVHHSSNNQHQRLIRLHQFQSIVQIASFKGFARTMALLGLLFLLSFLYLYVSTKKVITVVPLPKQSIQLLEFTKPLQQNTATVANNFSTFHTSSASIRSMQSIANPIPALVMENDVQFDNIILPTSTSDVPNSNVGEWGNSVNGTDGTENTVVTNVRKEEVIPSMDEFLPVQKEPNVDLALLQKNVVYPEMALRAGVEGTVVVRALILSTGAISTVSVLTSDSDLLNEAAITAVKKSVFTPAIAENTPVTCWITIPISFRIR